MLAGFQIDANVDHDVLFNPETIALVGASNTPGKMGNLFATRLAESFGGRIYPINHSAPEVAGIKAYRSIDDLPEAVDVVIALVPGPDLMTVIESCPPGKVRYMIAVPSGFAEVDEHGAAEQARLLSIAKARGIRLVGPNCVGFMNGEIGLNGSMIPLLPPPGRGISCLTQSGGFGMALAMYSLDNDLPVAKFCDLGNMVDVEIEELLRYLATDTATEAILLYVESVRDPVSFMATLRSVARLKPVILAGIGTTEAGRQASRAHLGMNPNYTDIDAGGTSGLIVAETGQEAMDLAKAISWQRPITGRRMAILTGTGGIGGELADLAFEAGFDVPRFSTDLQNAIGQHLPDYAGTGNPVDVTPIWWQYERVYPEIIRRMNASNEIDCMIVCVTDVASTLPGLADALIALSRNDQLVPLVIFWGSRDGDLELMRRLQAENIPCYRSTRSAVRAAAALTGAAAGQIPK